MASLRKVIAAAAVASAVAIGTPASAVTLLINYTPTTDTNPAFSFLIDSNPTPIAFGSSSFSAAIQNGTGQYNGVTSATFYSLMDGGLFDLYYGPQIFTGPDSAPSLFTSGSYIANFANDANLSGTLTINEFTGAVPEPAAWALMLLGFGAVGVGLRRRRTSVRLQFT